MTKTNPRLKAVYLEVVNNQLTANDPPETKKAFDRLIAEGYSEDETKVLIAQAVCVETYHMLKNGQEFNLERFAKNLERLPQEPEE